jgi:hypothetical protein
MKNAALARVNLSMAGGEAAEDMWCVVDKLMTNALRHRGIGIPEGGDGFGCHVEAGGWSRVDVLLAHINGDGYVRGARAMQGAASRKGAGEGEGMGEPKPHYTYALPNREKGRWNIDLDDVLHCALTSGKDRYQIMCLVNLASGVAIPYWIRARQGHSLPSVVTMRTSLQLFSQPEHIHPRLCRLCRSARLVCSREVWF